MNFLGRLRLYPIRKIPATGPGNDSTEEAERHLEKGNEVENYSLFSSLRLTVLSSQMKDNLGLF